MKDIVKQLAEKQRRKTKKHTLQLATKEQNIRYSVFIVSTVINLSTYHSWRLSTRTLVSLGLIVNQ